MSLPIAAALACGYCVEDRIAAVYQHASVTQALERKHHVVFFAINGNIAPGDGAQRALEIITESVKGVDPGSAKVSIESSSLALAFDPKAATLAALQQALAQKWAAKNMSLQALRIIEQSGQMKVVDEKK